MTKNYASFGKFLPTIFEIKKMLFWVKNAFNFYQFVALRMQLLLFSVFLQQLKLYQIRICRYFCMQIKQNSNARIINLPMMIVLPKVILPTCR
jgi:hypothetical protein